MKVCLGLRLSRQSIKEEEDHQVVMAEEEVVLVAQEAQEDKAEVEVLDQAQE